jgi:Lysylphosphatidylglycerol synthase TM region
MQNVEPAPKVSRKLWRWLKVVFALILIGFVLSRTDLQQLLGLRDRLSLEWMGISFILFCLLTLTKALQYWFLTGRKIPYPGILNITVLQNFLSNFVADTAGVVSYLAMFRSQKEVRYSRAALSFVLVKFCDLTVVWLELIIASALVWTKIDFLRPAILLLLAFVGATLAIFWIGILVRQRFVSAVARVVRRFDLQRFSAVARGMGVLTSLAEQDNSFILQISMRGLGLSLVYMVITLFWGFSNLRAFHLPLGFLEIAFVNGLMQLLSIIPGVWEYVKCPCYICMACSVSRRGNWPLS